MQLQSSISRQPRAAQPENPQSASLGNIAKNSSTASQSRFLRFYAQRLASELLPDERIGDCLRRTIPGKTCVEVVRKAESASPSYRNLMTCNSIWHCPVCAAKITERRRIELTKAIANTRLTPVLITYTFQHHMGMNLDAILDAMLKAFGRFKTGRSWQGITYSFRWAGSVRALEVTHGENGWHPHMHELVFLETQLDAIEEARLWQVLSERWIDVLGAQGLTASRENGLDVRTGNKAIGEYVTKGSKWGLEHELTKAPAKNARRGGRTPFALLLDYGDGDEESGRLFIQYAKSFKGRQQLAWSAHLRARLGLSEDEPAEQDEISELDTLLASLTLQEWKALYLSDQRATLLDVATSGDPARIEEWLVSVGIRDVTAPPAPTIRYSVSSPDTQNSAQLDMGAALLYTGGA